MATTKPKPSASTNLLDPQELIALARLDMERGTLEEALRKLKQVLSESQPPAEPLAMTARLYAQLGLYDRAKNLFQQYLQTQPSALLEAFQLGMVCFDAGQPQEANKIWEDLLKNPPTHPPALFYRALVLAQEGQVTQAKQTLDVLLKSAPADNLYFGRAKELLQNMEVQRPTATAVLGGNGSPKEAIRIPTKDAYKTEPQNARSLPALNNL